MKNQIKNTKKLIIHAYSVMILMLIIAGCNDMTSSVDEINENSIESQSGLLSNKVNSERVGTTKIHSDVSLMSMHGEAIFSDLTTTLLTQII